MAYHVGFRAVHGDLTSSRGFRWPYPGKMAVAPGPVIESNKQGCPIATGDGLCIAKTFKGAASGGIAAITCLVVRYNDNDVLGQDDNKVRVSKCKVVEIIDLPLLARHGLLPAETLADLRSADLRSADLRWANLRWADLRWANLSSANLCSADLRSADLRSADLSSADLRSADLRSANLRSADLSSADLRSADLRWADLRWADLRSADLRSADLSSADLSSAINYTLPSKWKLNASGIVVPA